MLLNAIVNFTQIVKATCLMTITHTNSNNSHTPEFKRASLEKRKEVINIPTKAEERPMIQISFRTQDQHVKIGTIRIRAKIHS